MRNKYFLKTPSINILEKPRKNSNISSQIIYGENFKILGVNREYFKIKCLYDGYIGFIKKIKKSNYFKPTHKINVLKSRIYLGKKKKRTNKFLPLASKIEILDKEKNFVMFEKDKWLKSKEICELSKKNRNYSKIFKYFLNCKYKWGGKTFEGIDCSALLQIFFNLNNEYFPRDTVNQVEVKEGVLFKKKFKKGDIIFWKGHVAMCINSKNLIHAYGPRKKVVLMPIKKTISLIKKTAKLEVKKVIRI